MADVRTQQHSMTRIDVSTGIPFDRFRSAFEKAAAPVDLAAVQQIVEDGGTWDDVRAAVAKNAPQELMVYAKIDATPLLAVAGHHIQPSSIWSATM